MSSRPPADRLYLGDDNPAEQYFDDNTLTDLIDEYRAIEDPDLRQHARDMMRARVEQSAAGSILEMDPAATETLFEPEDTGEGYWIGAPAAEDHRGERYLAVRERSPEERGHTIRLYREDDDSYDEVTAITADDLGVVSIERAELVSDGKELHCYIPVEHGENDWTIDRLDPVEDPADLDPATRETVLDQGAGSDGETVKDPDILQDDDILHMYYHGSDEKYGIGTEQAHYARSDDGGGTWERGDSNPVLERELWHDNHARTATMLEIDDAMLAFYEGSGLEDRGNTWNLRTGIGLLEEHGEPIIDLSRDAPELGAPAADQETGLESYGTLRYMEIMDDEDSYQIFFEMAREDGSFELRTAETAK